MSDYDLIEKGRFSAWIISRNEKDASDISNLLKEEYKNKISALGTSLNSIKTTPNLSVLSVRLKIDKPKEDEAGGAHQLLTDIYNLINKNNIKIDAIIVSQSAGAAWNAFTYKSDKPNKKEPKEEIKSKFSTLR